MICPSCGVANQPAQKFCGGCGKPLIASREENFRSQLDQARVLYEDGALSESEAAFRRLLQTGAHKGEALYGLGLIRYRLGDFDSARTSFEESLELDPQNANACYYLGEIAEKLRTSELALSLYHRTLQLNPQHAGAIHKLKSLGRRESARPDSGAPATAAQQEKEKSLDLAGPAEFGIYELVCRDPSPLAQHTKGLIDSLRMTVRPRVAAYLGRPYLVFAVLVLLILFGVAIAMDSALPFGTPRNPAFRALRAFVRSIEVGAVVGLILFPVMACAFAMLRAKTTVIAFEQGRMQIAKGIFAKHVENIELYRVADLELHRSFVNRLTGDGTIVLSVQHRHPARLNLIGVARIDRLEEIFRQLRNLVLLLRTGAWGKGVIY